MYPGPMVDRLWWFVTGLVAGGILTVRALGRRPTARDLGRAAARTGSDVMRFAARGIRPRNRMSSARR